MSKIEAEKVVYIIGIDGNIFRLLKNMNNGVQNALKSDNYPQTFK